MKAHGNAKLNVELVRGIRESLALGVPPSTISRMLNIPKTTVRDIASGKTWRKVK